MPTLINGPVWRTASIILLRCGLDSRYLGCWRCVKLCLLCRAICFIRCTGRLVVGGQRQRIAIPRRPGPGLEELIQPVIHRRLLIAPRGVEGFQLAQVVCHRCSQIRRHHIGVSRRRRWRRWWKRYLLDLLLRLIKETTEDSVDR